MKTELQGFPNFEGHSPAPWKWCGTNKEPASNAYLDDGDGVFVLAIPDSPCTGRANARLIASAPALLARCIELENENAALRCELGKAKPAAA